MDEEGREIPEVVTDRGVAAPALNFEAAETPEGPPQVRPWVRYFARSIDVLLFATVVGFVGGIVVPEILKLPDLVLGMLLLFLWVFGEAALLWSWGTTPGKSLLGITLSDDRRDDIGFARALSRSFTVWWKGMGAGLPLLPLITCVIAYRRLTRQGKTAWDEEKGFTVTHGPIGTARTVLAVLIFAAFTLIVAFSMR